MAVRHISYEVEPGDFEVMREALVYTLGQVLQDRFTSEVRAIHCSGRVILSPFCSNLSSPALPKRTNACLVITDADVRFRWNPRGGVYTT